MDRGPVDPAWRLVGRARATSRQPCARAPGAGAAGRGAHRTRGRAKRPQSQSREKRAPPQTKKLKKKEPASGSAQPLLLLLRTYVGFCLLPTDILRRPPRLPAERVEPPNAASIEDWALSVLLRPGLPLRLLFLVALCSRHQRCSLRIWQGQSRARARGEA